MRPFAFEQPTSLREAISILAGEPDARLLAGGTDLIIGLRDGSLRASPVIDVKRVAELDGDIATHDGSLRIGALTTMTDIAADPRIRDRFTALAEGAAVVGSVQIRNRATLAGNICNASPAADTTPALLAFGASVVASGPGGERRIPIDQIFAGSGGTTLQPAEVVIGIELPDPGIRRGSTHVRRTRRRGHDLASVTIACVIDDAGFVRLAYGSVGPRPIVVSDASGLLADPGGRDEDRLTVLDGMFSAAAPSPRSMRASPEYRLAMLRVLGLRALAMARERLADARSS